MVLTSSIHSVQEAAWKLLKGLRPQRIDLSRIHYVRQADIDQLNNQQSLIELLPQLGLNNEGLDEFPLFLHQYCGKGLFIWQFPVQFAAYLAFLGHLKVNSYLELGIRHGGSYVATVEILDRFNPLEFAIGIDIIPCPSMTEYAQLNSRSRFFCINSQSPAFLDLLHQITPVDLVFIDSHHEESQCRREFSLLSPVSNMIAFHDIANISCPGIAVIWNEIKRSPEWTCYEFVDQYPGNGPFMGIGLMIKNNRIIT